MLACLQHSPTVAMWVLFQVLLSTMMVRLPMAVICRSHGQHACMVNTRSEYMAAHGSAWQRMSARHSQAGRPACMYASTAPVKATAAGWLGAVHWGFSQLPAAAGHALPAHLVAVVPPRHDLGILSGVVAQPGRHMSAQSRRSDQRRIVHVVAVAAVQASIVMQTSQTVCCPPSNTKICHPPKAHP